MNGFDELLELGAALGLTEAQARSFAIGRDGTERGARAAFAEAAARESAAAAAEAATPLVVAMDDAVAAVAVGLGMGRSAARGHVADVVAHSGVREPKAVIEYLSTYARGLRGSGR